MSELLGQQERDLFHAIWCGQADEVIALLKGGADPSAVDPASGLRPIHVAAHKGNLQIIHALLGDQRVFADSVDRRGKVPYEWADDFHQIEAEMLLVRTIIDNPKKYRSQSIREAQYHVKLKQELAPA